MSENIGQPNGNNNLLNALGRFTHLYDQGNSDKQVELLKQITRLNNNLEQTNSRGPRMVSQGVFQDRQSQRSGMQFEENSTRRASRNYRRSGSLVGDIEQGIKDELMSSFKKSNLGKGLQGALDQFSKQFGFEFKDLPHEYGKHLGDKLFKNLSKMKFSRSNKLNGLVNKGLNYLGSNYFDTYFGKGTFSNIKNVIKAYGNGGKGGWLNAFTDGGIVGKGGSIGGAGGGQAGKQIADGALSNMDKTKLMKGMDKAVKGAGAVAIIAYIAYKLVKPLLEGIGDVIKAWGKALNRDEDERKKRLVNGQKRLQQDVEAMARLPFTILEEAAKRWEDTWDQNLSKVALTQGYTKENTYALYSSIAERLNKEALGNVIPATDVVNNLSQVLESGLSGKVAEEFAYQATKLNAEIPTENFIGYASTYAQIAADQINAGMSQQEALNYATRQLQLFASNLLYSSRELAGGFTSGLRDASSLFQSATEIVQTAKKGDVASVSGTLTSISALVGAIAPDLASGLVNNVVQAAIGGNSDTIVALRSLAGINAGNTAFLQQLAEDPQGLFVRIFQGLGNMQTMSPGNYMEVAEGLSSVFGVDMKALARVDFNNLATQISQMQVNDSSLRENVALLVTEQATTSAAQARYQEINQQILDDGLAYVIDSEYGRMVQQHMWEEQLANEIQSTTYAVELQGAGLSLMEGLRHAVANILNFLNPIGWLGGKIADLQGTRQEARLNDENIAKLLEANKVGGGNATSFKNLVTRGTDLGLTTHIKKAMGTDNTWLKNAVAQSKDTVGQWGALLTNPLAVAVGLITASNGGDTITSGSTWNNAVDKVGGLSSTARANISSTPSKAISSYLGFLNAGVGKSALSLTSGSSISLAAVKRASGASNATNNADEAMNRRTQAWLDSAKTAVGKYNPQTGKVEGGSSFDEWYSSYSKYGIANANEALGTYGKSKEEVRAYFESLQGQQGATAENARKEDQDQFRTDVRTYWNFKEGTYQSIIWNPFINDYISPFFTPESGRYDVTMALVNTALTNIQAKQDIMISQIGDAKNYTVIGALTTIINQIQTTFINGNSFFQRCLADWIKYIASKTKYQTDLVADDIRAWSDMAKAKDSESKQASLALANALNEFTAKQIQELDPQLQANVLLGKIVIILEAIMQQNNTVGGGLSLIDTLSALSVGKTK